MPIKTLLCHPASPSSCTAVRALTVAVERKPDGHVTLRYQLTGDFSRILLPAPKLSAASDGLWQHTCFEAFMTSADTTSYHEFNFSPSCQWAAYAFDSYREQRPWVIPRPPKIDVMQAQDRLVLTAGIHLDDLPDADHLLLGLTAVIESTDGGHSYWALHHPGSTPDFHARAGFVCRL
ncbi:MAG: DOMON-like domain-containing protein [Gammaproteobacteria bacterium]